MTIVQASSISSSLPADLKAWVFFHRPAEGETVRLIAVGDTSFSGRIERLALEIGWENLFRDFSPFFREAQVLFANFENSLQGSCRSQTRTFFTPLPESVHALKAAGFNVINLANNHILDNGVDGLTATFSAIRSAGMRPLGAGTTKDEASALIKMKVGNLCLGWLACGHTLLEQPGDDYKFWEFDEQELLKAIRRAHEDVDILIVSVHIGLMFLDYPRPELKLFAEKAIDSGANIILMHHAHVLQGVQDVAEKGIVCYNMGNFLLDWQEGEIEAAVAIDQQNEGAVFVFDLDSNGISQVVVLPSAINEDGMVHWAVGIQGEKILQRLVRISGEILGDYVPAFEAQRASRNASHILNDLAFQIRTRRFSSLWGMLKRFRMEHIRMFFRWLLDGISGNKESVMKQ